ncbi:PAS domain-containing protein [Aciduricibacillus chroicocephali]|uniref:PAS domain-containing protein n=1 Tax=Aciduricibacillus chroicocephali TaxID=3054939 RepID=A0ABY9KSH5_9BACI|nr:PAS domain-containing protein [Bacillaceae bacterium 44XB]
MVQMRFNEFDLIQKNEFISNAIDRAGVGVVITDPSQDDNPIIYVNKGFEELTGYEASEILGLNCRFLQHGEETFDKRRKIREAINSEKLINLPLKNYKKDGTPFWNDLNIYPVRLKEMDKLYFIGIQKDVTKQVEAEHEVKRNLASIRKLSTPIIPISVEVAVLPLIGEMSEQRQQQLMEDIGTYTEQEQKDFIILDLSGISKFDERIHWTIHSIRSMLNLMGCELILTGITPNLAIAGKDGLHDLGIISSFSTVERAIKFLNSKK